MNFVQRIFNLYAYQEIHDCLVTLRVIKIIRTFQTISVKNLKLNYNTASRETNLDNIIDTMFYLMHNITESIIDDINMDSKLVADMIYNNFVYKLQSNSDQEEIEEFYDDINRIIDRIISRREDQNAIKKVSKDRLSVRKATLTSLSFKKEEVSKGLNEFKKLEEKVFQKTTYFLEIRTIYNKLKETLQYKYCIYKMKLIDNKIYQKDAKEYLDISYNSSDDEASGVESENSNENLIKPIKKSENDKEKEVEINHASKLIFLF